MDSAFESLRAPPPGEVRQEEKIQARDLEQAVELSKGCPIFEVDGAVEVRPVMKMNM